MRVVQILVTFSSLSHDVEQVPVLIAILMKPANSKMCFKKMCFWSLRMPSQIDFQDAIW